MSLRFSKYHGLGNDFIVVEGPLMDPERARRLCDRHRGIGADGVMTMLPPRAGGAAYMHLFNSDASVAPMCGNGVRCAARWLAERRGLDGELVVETDAGPRRCTVHRGPGGAVESVAVEMGPGRILGEEDFAVGGETLHAIRVDMGNAQAVFFDRATRERALAVGPAIDAQVPGGVNAGFATLRAGGIDLVVWERGAGLTEACGTGACAAVAAAVHTGRLGAGEAIEVRLPGGVLAISVSADLARITMSGPAEKAFEGETEL